MFVGPLQNLRSRFVGSVLLHRLDRVMRWAHRQGLELVADCHLERINQVCALYFVFFASIPSFLLLVLIEKVLLYS